MSTLLASDVVIDVPRSVSSPSSRCPTFRAWIAATRRHVSEIGPWAVIPLGLVIAPLVTWFPMLAMLYPEFGLPRYPAAIGVDFWGAHVLWLTLLGGIAATVWRFDRWLALAVAFPALLIFWRAYSDPVYALVLAGAALGYVAMRYTPDHWRGRIRILIAASGMFQALYVLQQARLNYDLLWGPLVGGTLIPRVQAIGTMGTVDGASAYIAITAPLMPLWALPVAIAAVVESHSFGAMAALVAGLIVQYRSRWFVWPLASAGLFATITLAIIKGQQTARPAIQAFGLEHAFREHPWIGWGLGGWKLHVPALQRATGFVPNGELWAEAHSDWVQWATETGIVGFVILCGWLVAHHAIFFDRVWGGSLVALATNAGVFFPLRVVPIALIAVVVIGLAVSPRNDSDAVGGA